MKRKGDRNDGDKNFQNSGREYYQELDELRVSHNTKHKGKKVLKRRRN
jgi:hypothetical protein